MKLPENSAIPHVSTVCIAALLLLISLFTLGQMNAEPINNADKDYVHSVASMTLPPLQALSVSREFSGRIEAQQTLNLGFELAGTIINMRVNDGDFVKKGQLLAQLDPQLLQADLKQLNAKYTQVQARLTLNQQTLKRQQTLKSNNYAAEQKLDELQAEQQELQANLLLIQTQQQQIRIRLKKSSLYAPFQGQISFRYRVKGAVIRPSEPIFEIVQDQQLDIKLSVPLTLGKQLEIGETIAIKTLEGLTPLRFNARIESISRSISEGSYTQTLRLSLPEKLNHAQLSNGQIVVATISEQREEMGYWLPISALTEGLRGSWNILILGEPVNEQRQIKKLAVNTLYFQHAKVFIAASPYLTADSLIVTNGTQRVSNLQWVLAP